MAITAQGLRVDGTTRLLYGGEVQYYRIRDRARDPARTQRMWEEALDQAAAAGMNMVTTYVPWDYHEPAQGRFSFTGVTDLGAFLELCHQRSLLAVVKPGPFINSEWPRGVGSFGAVPEWFKRQNTASLALGPKGKPFSTGLLGGVAGRQPSYFAPELLVATERFFAQLAPIFLRYIHERPTICGLQIDNETNFYFADRYKVGYSSHGLRQYREFLQARYGALTDLNAAYGTVYGSFAEVEPPRAAPGRGDPTRENRKHQDWFDAGKQGIEDYHLALRAMWERLGVREPDVVFFTNDSPHTMPAELGRENLVLWDGPSKNRGGLAALDAYPKQFPTTPGPLDYPFLTSYFSKRFGRANDRYPFAGGAPVAAGKCYGLELEAGLFELPFLRVALPVPDATTDHILLQHVGRGSALAVVYVFRAGLNADDTPYFSHAPVGIDGQLQSRYQVLKRWGRVVTTHGDALLASQAVEVPVALVVDGRFDAPAGGVAGHPGRVKVNEAVAAFGMLEDAGLDPDVVDARHLRPGDLSRYRMVVFVNPDVVDPQVADALSDYVDGGGHLVNLLHTGRHDAHWKRNTVPEQKLAQGLFGDGQRVGIFENLGVLGTTVVGANVNLRVPHGAVGPLKGSPFLAKYRLVGAATPLAWDRTFPLGRDGDVAAWTAPRGSGSVTHFGTNPAGVYANSIYYKAKPEDLGRVRDLTRWLAARAGVTPVVSVEDAAGTCWARRLPAGGAFLFVGGRLDAAAQIRVEVHDLAALGLDAGSTFALTEVLSGQALGQTTGADLAGAGLSLDLEAYGTAVVRITELRGD